MLSSGNMSIFFIIWVDKHSHGKGPGNTRAVYAKTRFSRGLTQTCRTCCQVQTLHNYACKIFLSCLTSNWRGHLIGHVTIKQDWRLCFLDSLDFPSTGEILIAGTGSLQIMWYEVEKDINVEIFFLHFSWKGPCSQASMQFGKVPQWNRKTKETFTFFWSSWGFKDLQTKVFKSSSYRSGTVLSSHYALFHSLGLLADILRFIRWNKHFMISACFMWQPLPSDSVFFPLCRWGRGYYSRQLLGPWVSNCTGCNSLAFDIL